MITMVKVLCGMRIPKSGYDPVGGPGRRSHFRGGEARNTFMMKNSKKAAHAIDNQNTREQNPNPTPSAGRKTLRIFGKAVDLTIDLAAGSIVTVFKALGT